MQIIATSWQEQEPANATQSFSPSSHPTVSRTIPVLEYMQTAWENMANNPKFEVVEDAIQAGLKNLGKWYRKVDETDVYFICHGMLLLNQWLSQLISTPVALDPSIKLAYAEQEWEPGYFTSGRARLEQVVCLLCLIPN